MKNLILLLLFFTSSIAFSQDELTARIVTPAENISKYEKLEIAVSLPEEVALKVKNFLKENRVHPNDKINPFLEWELDVQTVFTHPASGTTKLIDGFYYREYDRDTVANNWQEKDLKNELIRVRFAPPLEGMWTCSLLLNLKGKATEYVENLKFNVNQGTNPGYVSVHPNKKNLQHNGSLIYPVGTNFPSPSNGVSIYHITGNGIEWGADETYKVAHLNNWLDYHNDIKKYHDQGGKYIRILQSGWSSLLEFEKKGNYYDRQPYAWEQDRLLEYCEQNGIYIHFNLMQQEPFMKYGNYDMFDWDFSQYRRDGSFEENPQYPSYAYSGNTTGEAYKMFLDETDLKYHEQRMRYYISRYGYSTSIYLFELLSEPYHLNQIYGREEPMLQDTPEGDSVRLAIKTYHTRMAQYVKQTMKHDEHLLGVNFFNVTLFKDEKFWDQSIYSPDIDVISMNPYSQVIDRMIISKSTPGTTTDLSENTTYRSVHLLSSVTGKPILMAEGGAGDLVDHCSSFKPQQIDMSIFGFCGFASFNSWKGWSAGEEKEWPQMIRCQNFMENPDVLQVFNAMNGNWIQGRQAEKISRSDDKKSKELQFYVSEDKKMAAGYVRNRTANYFTLRTDEACNDEVVAAQVPWNRLTNISWDEGTKELYITGLEKRRKYTVTWYSVSTGQAVLSECQKGSKKFILKFPELTVETGAEYNPVFWFVIKESDCK